jgi:hypothetical protein
MSPPFTAAELRNHSDLELWDLAGSFSKDDPGRRFLHAEICRRGGLLNAVLDREPSVMEILAGALVDSGGDWAKALYMKEHVTAPLTQSFLKLRAVNRVNAKKPRKSFLTKRLQAQRLYATKTAQGISPEIARQTVRQALKIPERTMYDYLKNTGK